MDLINPIKCFYVCCRRMFPTIRCSFSGFQDFLYGQKFAIVLDVVACDNKRYRYAYHRSSWLVAGKADPGGYNCEVFLNWLKFIYSEKATNFLQNLHLTLSYVVAVKSEVEILKNFVAFSEYMNFKCQLISTGLFVIPNSSKKRTKKIDVTTMVP